MRYYIASSWEKLGLITYTCYVYFIIYTCYVYFICIKRTSQIHLRKNVFFKTSQIHHKKDAFYVTPLRRPKHNSKKQYLFCNVSKYVSKVYLENICDYSKISHYNDIVLIKYSKCVNIKNIQKMKRHFLRAMHSD